MAKSPKWPSVAAVDVSKCPVTKGRKGQKNSRRVVAKRPSAVVHKHSTTGEDGEAMHWIRLFEFGEGGPEYIHGPSYHTKDSKGRVRNAQFASMLPRQEYSVLIGEAIERGIITLPRNTLEFLRKQLISKEGATRT